MRGRNGSGRVKRGARVTGGRHGDGGADLGGVNVGGVATGGRVASARPALVVCDLDGTLLDYHSMPAPGVLHAVAALRAAAVPVVICTGRAVGATRALAGRLGLKHGVAIAYHGAVVVDVAGGRWLQRLDLPRDAVGPLVATIHAAGATLTAYVDDERWVQAEPDCPAAAGDARATSAAVITSTSLQTTVPVTTPTGTPAIVRPQRDLAAALEGVSVTRLIVEAPDGGHIIEDLTARWPELAVSAAAAGHFEVHHARADKRTALAALCGRLGVPAGAVVACGDGAPDAGMLSWAGMGIAIAEGHETAAAAADVVVARDELAGLLTSLAGAPPEASSRRR
jgi:hypothetical protein